MNKTWELIYSFSTKDNVSDEAVASVCVEIRSLPGVANVELSKMIHIPGAVGTEYDYQLVVILQGKAAVSVVQQHIEQYRDKLSCLNISFFQGTHQTLQ